MKREFLPVKKKRKEKLGPFAPEECRKKLVDETIR